MGKSTRNTHGRRRPVIKVEAGKLHQIATEGEAALVKARAPFYVHGDQLKRPVIDEIEASKGRVTKVARLALVTSSTVRDHLSRAADWQRYSRSQKKWVAADPPWEVGATILSRDGEWMLPRIVGVITTPTMRPDGSLLCNEGYDLVTRLLLLNPCSVQIPEQPDREDALAALDLMDGLLREFPFVDEASRSVALSTLITPVIRGAMPVVPLHTATAPEAGSGKSYLFDIASAIAIGQACPVISAGRNEEETEKRLGAALMKGQPIVSIDNLNGTLRGDALCQMIERPSVEVRVLGLSKMVRIESRTSIFGNGNNLIIIGDLVRRAIRCSLDPNMERPELRQFGGDPFSTVLADRGRYIAAALTIPRAYLLAGCPGVLPPLASFEEWSRFVRSALVWLGRPDPLDTMEEARTEDPERADLRDVVASWRFDPLLRDPLTAGELKNNAEQTTDTLGNHLDRSDLKEALLRVAAVRGVIDTRRLGKWLSRNKGRVVDGVKIVGREDKKAKQQRWELVVGGSTRGG